MDCPLDRLPDETILKIFDFLDFESLGRLSSTCRRFYKLLDIDAYNWRKRTPFLLGSNLVSEDMQRRTRPDLTMKDRCKVGQNWRKGTYQRRIVMRQKRCMPWLYLEQDYLFCSKKRMLLRLIRESDGSAIAIKPDSAHPHNDDISKFVINGTELVSAGRDGTMSRRKKGNFSYISTITCHQSEIQSIDSKEDVIITGSRGGSIKIWKTNSIVTDFKKKINMGIRILSLAIMPSNRFFICGLPGTNDIHPLQLFDLEKAKQVSVFGSAFREGAGIIDIFPESEHTFLCCGYDTTVQLWDVRCTDACALRWVEPYDNTIYCVRSDYNITIVSGAGRSSLVHVWDRRSRNYLHVHSVRDFDNSPTYCLSFDASYIFAAFDRGVAQLSFLKGVL